MSHKPDKYKALRHTATTLMAEGHVEEGIMLDAHILSLEERDGKIGDKPSCPHCGGTLVRCKYSGYYESFEYWDCDCNEGTIPIEYTVHGDYA